VRVEEEEEDPDLALARTLQEQERAYFLLATGGGEEYAGQEPANDAPGESETYDDDEAFARALQQAEMNVLIAAQMGFANAAAGYGDDVGTAFSGNTREETEELTDPDNMSYEQLTALGEVVGTQDRGISEEAMSQSLVETVFCAKDGHQCSDEQCTVCRCEFEDQDKLYTLPCSHYYHRECISQWLKINKQCPICSCEVC